VLAYEEKSLKRGFSLSVKGEVLTGFTFLFLWMKQQKKGVRSMAPKENPKATPALVTLKSLAHDREIPIGINWQPVCEWLLG
jgi:hypothetical protein